MAVAHLGCSAEASPMALVWTEDGSWAPGFAPCLSSESPSEQAPWAATACEAVAAAPSPLLGIASPGVGGRVLSGFH